MTIKDKTVLVTGANRGIGQALAAEALARGAKRVYAGTRQPLAHPDDRVTPLNLDVTSTAQIQAAASQVGSLDMLINNAGVALPDDLTDPAVLERHLAVNLFGTWAVTQAFLPAVTRSGGAIDPVASRSCGRTRGKGSRGPARPGGYRYDPGIRHTQGISGIGRAGAMAQPSCSSASSRR
jgi:NAD(P)-dependent dehydrogenase (short-subunit alcohol dehydrogenase family)